MFHEVATLVHLIESSKPETRAEGMRLDRAAGGAQTPINRGATVPRERSDRQLVRDKAVHKKIAGDFVLISPMSVSRLCRLDKGSSRDARRFLRPAIDWE